MRNLRPSNDSWRSRWPYSSSDGASAGGLLDTPSWNCIHNEVHGSGWLALSSQNARSRANSVCTSPSRNLARLAVNIAITSPVLSARTNSARQNPVWSTTLNVVNGDSVTMRSATARTFSAALVMPQPGDKGRQTTAASPVLTLKPRTIEPTHGASKSSRPMVNVNLLRYACRCPSWQLQDPVRGDSHLRLRRKRKNDS